MLCEPLLAIQPPTQTALVDAFFAYVQSFFYGRGFGAWAGYATPGCQNTTIDVTRADRQWWWQTCTEFGYFQPAPAVNSVRSTRLTLDYFRQHCADLFGAGVWPDTEATNRCVCLWVFGFKQAMNLDGVTFHQVSCSSHDVFFL